MTNNSGDTKRTIQEKGYGLYRIVLQPNCFFELQCKSQQPSFVVIRTPRANHIIEQRMISGTYRRARDLQDTQMSLEIIHDLNAIIPYDTITSCERLAVNPF